MAAAILCTNARADITIMMILTPLRSDAGRRATPGMAAIPMVANPSKQPGNRIGHVLGTSGKMQVLGEKLPLLRTAAWNNQGKHRIFTCIADI